jgi:hypothetical protein
MSAARAAGIRGDRRPSSKQTSANDRETREARSGTAPLPEESIESYVVVSAGKVPG